MADEPESPFPEDREDPPSSVDSASHQRSRRRQKREQTEREAFWSGVLKTKIGRREIYGILQSLGLWARRFVNGPNGFPQSEATWGELGKKDWALEFYRALLVIDAQAVVKMQRENDPLFQKPEPQPQEERPWEPWPVEDR